jgi:hypothetical protein
VILSAEDTEIYFPSLNLVGTELDAAIRSAQMMAESPRGADRPLEIRPYSETCVVAGADQTFMVANFPLLETPEPVVRIRSPQYLNFGRNIPATSWVTLTRDRFQVDANLGEVQVLPDFFFGGSPALRGAIGAREGANFEAQITYSSGFEFHADDPTPEVQAIKQAVANILIFQNPQALPESQSLLASGATAFTLQGVYSVAYGSDAFSRVQSSLLDTSLQVLAKYAPRSLM